MAVSIESVFTSKVKGIGVVPDEGTALTMKAVSPLNKHARGVSESGGHRESNAAS